jgi:hypothetical protein
MKTLLLCVLASFLATASYGQIAVIFDGTDFGPNVIPRSWGQSTMEIDPGMGVNGADAIKWVQGNDGSGRTGIQFSARQPIDLTDTWQVAMVTLRMKCEPGVDSLRLQCVSPTGKKGIVFHPITDNDWHKYKFPLPLFTYTENSSTFDWSGVTTIDLMTEADAVAGKISYITDWYIATAPTIVLFNGIAVPLNLDLKTWGASSVDVIRGTGNGAGSNALQWVQGEGKTGFRFGISPAANLSEVWEEDSLNVEIKTAQAAGPVTIMLYSAGTSDVVGVSFAPVADNQWHHYMFPLRSLTPLRGTTEFDPATITSVEVQAGDAGDHGIAGTAVNFFNFWTGNPFLDRVPPAPPSDLCLSSEQFANLIMWSDSPGETHERYNIYYSDKPITDIKQAEVARMRIKEDVGQAEHLLFAPMLDQPVSYYYAVTCMDASGNESVPAFLDPYPNTAQGIPVVSLHGPGANFVADGSLSEWSGVRPFHRRPSDGTQYVVSWGQPFNNDADLSFDAYLAVDNSYLYIAFDVTDNNVNFAASATSDQDSPNLHIGLYNWHGSPHLTYKRGPHPDYLIRFTKSRALIDLVSHGDSLLLPGADYYWGAHSTTGYRVEARIPWTLLAERGGDSVFVPVEGCRIPIDFMVNDADAGVTRESMLEWSPFSDGTSDTDPSVWVNTWMGESWAITTAIKDDQDFALSYALSQNYPNPFNPMTSIRYTIGGVRGQGLGARDVSLIVYDLLGREVATLVDEPKAPGSYEVRFDGSRLASGVYVYQLTAGSFNQSRKMILMK